MKKIQKALFLLSLSLTSIKMTHCAEERESHVYETLRNGASNTSFLTIGTYTGSKLVSNFCKAIKLTLFNKNCGDAETIGRTFKPSAKMLVQFNFEILGAIATSLACNASLGKTKESLDYFGYGLILGAGFETFSRILSYLKEKNICAICLLHIDEEAVLPTHRIQPCNHSYHADCINQWFMRGNATCPTCRATIPAEQRRVITD